ncbi:MAG: arylsulfotransferase family protein [Candidatus Omnitrophota bacterium]
MAIKTIVISIVVGFVLTFKQFFLLAKSYFEYIAKPYSLKPGDLGWIVLNLCESLKQWLTLAIITALGIFIIWLLTLLIYNLFISSKSVSKGKIDNKFRIIMICTFCFIFFVCGGWIINRFLLPHRHSPFSLAGNFWFLISTLFLGISLINRTKKKIIYFGMGISIFGILSLITVIQSGFLYSWSQRSQNTTASQIEKLRSFPYAAWSPTVNVKTGITLYDQEASYKGINLYQSNNKPGAYILDMEGKVLHTFLDKEEMKYSTKLIKPYKNGNFLILHSGLYMIARDSSKMRLITKNCSHDFTYSDNGDIYVIENGYNRYLPKLYLMGLVVDRYLVVFNEYGVEKKRISIAKALSQSKVILSFIGIHKNVYSFESIAQNLIYLNGIEVIDKDIFYKEKKLFSKNNVLFCMRNLNSIGVIDVETENILWVWGKDELEHPHNPSMLSNGNILIFDNGPERKYSRVVEVNPVTQTIEWEYKGNPPESFYSKEMGSAQRLPNGNTLITESEKGRVFEVTKDKKVVWEFYNPELCKEGTERATIYRMMRIIDKNSNNSNFFTLD